MGLSVGVGCDTRLCALTAGLIRRSVSFRVVEGPTLTSGTFSIREDLRIPFVGVNGGAGFLDGFDLSIGHVGLSGPAGLTRLCRLASRKGGSGCG